MSLLRAMVDAVQWGFWRFVAWSGGPGHQSYIHARWRVYQARAGLNAFLRGD
jgi:hypothetical protein